MTARLPLVLLLPLLACAARPLDPGATDTDDPPDTTAAVDPATTASPPDTTAPPDPTTTTTTTTTSGTGNGDAGTGHGFIMEKDGGFSTKECDAWIEDCPAGQKCMPYSSDGDNAWDSLKCVPIVPDPDGVGEPCMVFGSGVSGEDTCDFHMMCWNVDPETDVGVCVAKCNGSPDNPQCDDPMANCLLGGEVLNLCIPECAPLLQDCPGNDLCVPNPQDPGFFICVIDASGDEGQPFDVCEYANACDAGLVCVEPYHAAECDQTQLGCCLPFCDLTAPSCPGMGQQCIPWLEDPPEHLANLGLCALPP